MEGSGPVGHCRTRRGVTYNGPCTRGEACRSNLNGARQRRAERMAGGRDRPSPLRALLFPPSGASPALGAGRPCAAELSAPGARDPAGGPRARAPAGRRAGGWPSSSISAPGLPRRSSVAAMVLTTGALHEDGLADTADSFGGTTREQAPRDHARQPDRLLRRLGPVPRPGAPDRRPGGIASRADARRRRRGDADHRLPVPHGRPDAPGLPARRPGGTALSHAVGQPPRETFWLAAGIAGAIAVVLGALAGLPPSGIALMIVLSGLAGLALTRLCGASSRRADRRHRRRRAAGRGDRRADRPLDRSRTVTT